MWIRTNKNVAFHAFLPAKTMAVLSSSCTILDPNFCCFHEERHGTRRFGVAPSNNLGIFGGDHHHQGMENGTVLHKKNLLAGV
jgi:hypothetical protein